MKKMQCLKWLMRVVVVIIVLLCLVYVLGSSALWYLFDRHMESRVDLMMLRGAVYDFVGSKDRYPDSLSELKPVLPKEHISSVVGNREQHGIMNNSGGWYYDPNTGEVRINLTKPIKHYMWFSFSEEHNEIPADW